jgi:hypothetical protein
LFEVFNLCSTILYLVFKEIYVARKPGNEVAYNFPENDLIALLIEVRISPFIVTIGVIL